MKTVLASPLVVFMVYLLLVGGISLLGKFLAGPSHSSKAKSSTYSSGEAAPQHIAVPGYRPFFVAALFFAVVHLGVLVLATGIPTSTAIIYLIGLMLALLALILG